MKHGAGLVEGFLSIVSLWITAVCRCQCDDVSARRKVAAQMNLGVGGAESELERTPVRPPG
jgi:hypothetical protein